MDNKRQYTPKYWILELTVIFTSTLIAISPEIKATTPGVSIFVFKVKDDSTKVRSQAPNIVGIPRRSEKYIASVFLIPRYIPVIRVIPDLDTPGTSANAWAIPTIKDCFSEICWNDIFWAFLNFTEKNNIIENIK